MAEHMTILDAKVSNPLEGGASFSARNRIIRAAWNVIWLLLASWTPPFMHPWRRFLLRIFGAKVARTANIYGSARIWLPSNLEIGEHSCIGRRVIIYSMGMISFGDYALASQGAHICAGTHDIEDPNFQLLVQPIKVGAHAWIAAEAFVGPGVNVGEGAVLGARACAFKDLDPWTVYVGSPARVLRRRIIRTSDSGRI